MKKLVLMGMSLLFMVGISFGQEQSVQEKAQEKVATLTEKLSLTEDQQAAVHEAVLELITAKEALKADTTLSEDVKAEQIKSFHQTADAKIVEVLTEEQKPLYEQIVQERNQKKESEPTPPTIK